MLADQGHDLGPERLRNKLRDHRGQQQVGDFVADVQIAVEIRKKQRGEDAGAGACDQVRGEKAQQRRIAQGARQQAAQVAMRGGRDIARRRITRGNGDHQRKQQQDCKPQVPEYVGGVVRRMSNAQIEQDGRQQRVDESAGGIGHAAETEQLGALLIVVRDFAAPCHVGHFVDGITEIEQQRPSCQIGNARRRRNAEQEPDADAAHQRSGDDPGFAAEACAAGAVRPVSDQGIGNGIDDAQYDEQGARAPQASRGCTWHTATAELPSPARRPCRLQRWAGA